MELIRHKLNNDFRVLLLPDKSSNTVSVGVFIKNGSRYETESKNGISHFLEHMLFKGDISIRLDNLGAKYNAETSYETTHYYISGNKNDTEQFLTILKDIYTNDTFTKNDIEIEKGVVIEELKMTLDDVNDVMNDWINKIIFRNSGLKRPIIGTEKNILKFTESDLIKLKQIYYIPSNSLLVVSGNFNKINVMKTINNTFGKIPKSNTKNKTTLIPKTIEQTKSSLFHKSDKFVSQTDLMFVFRTNTDRSRIVYDIIADILSSGCSSRLFELLRTQMSITYFNYSYYISYEHEGIFIIHLGVNKKRINEAITAILTELDRLKKNNIGDDELNKCKKIRETHISLETETPLDKLDFFGLEEILDIKCKNLSDTYKEIKNICLNEVQDTIRELFQNQNMSLFVYGGKPKKI